VGKSLEELEMEEQMWDNMEECEEQQQERPSKEQIEQLRIANRKAEQISSWITAAAMQNGTLVLAL